MPTIFQKTGAAGEGDFTFDYVLDSDQNQEAMYKVCAHETISQYMKGYNGTIFAYGQSGSGKTYTMLGPDEVIDVIKHGVGSKNKSVPQEISNLYGIIPRAIFDIFREINKAIETQNAQFEIRINYFEIYNESLNNLLASNPSGQTSLKLREQKNGGVLVLNCDPLYVTCPEDIFQFLMIGQQNRAIASTGQNERSSRSHTIVVLDYTQKNPDGSMKQAKLNLVDLVRIVQLILKAGSERIAKTGATGKTLEEAKVLIQYIKYRKSIQVQQLLEIAQNIQHKLLLMFLLEIQNLLSSLKNLQVEIQKPRQFVLLKSPKEMEQLIAKLKVEVQSLKALLTENGINPLSLPLNISNMNSNFLEQIEQEDEMTRITDISIIQPNQILTTNNLPLIMIGEDLNLKLTEVQNEFEHYKEYADTRIMALEDQVERYNQQNESTEELQNKIQGYKFAIQDQEDQIKKMSKQRTKEKFMSTATIQSLENQLQAKEMIFKDIEHQNEELRWKLEISGFETYDKIKKQIFNESLKSKIAKIMDSSNKQFLSDITKDIGEMEQKYGHQEKKIQELQDENSKLQIKIAQMEYFGGYQDPNVQQVNLDDSFTQTEIMSLHSDEEEEGQEGDDRGNHENISPPSQRLSDSKQLQQDIQQPSPKLNTPVSNNMRMSQKSKKSNNSQSYIKRGSLYSNKLSSHSGGSSSTFTKNFLKSTYKQSKALSKQLMSITLDNIKLIEMNNRLIAHINKQKDDHQDVQIESATLIEAELNSLEFQKAYLEKMIKDKSETRFDMQQQELLKRQEEKIKLLNLEVDQLRIKSIDLEEENQMLKKQHTDIKKEKNLLQLQQQKIIRDSVRQQLIQQKKKIYQFQHRGGIMQGEREIISQKVNLNTNLMAQQYYDDEDDDISFNNEGNDMRKFGSGVQRQQTQGRMPHSKQKISNSQIMLNNKQMYGGAIFNKNINEDILKVNPDHEGIIKTFSSKNDNMRELEELLNDSDDDEES